MIRKITYLKGLFSFLVVVFLTACSSSESTISYIDQDTLLERMSDDNAPLVIDVRPERFYNTAHVQGAINIPYSHLVKFLTDVPAEKDDDLVLYCEDGVFADKAIDLLHKAGWKKLYHLEGNMQEWSKAGLPTSFPLADNATS